MSVIIRKKCERTGREFPETMSDDDARRHLNGEKPVEDVLNLTFRDPAKPDAPPILIDYSTLSAQSLRLVRRCVAELAPKLPKERKKRAPRKPTAPAAPAAPAPSSETSAEAAPQSDSPPA